jgi:prophage regulatory protein
MNKIIKINKVCELTGLSKSSIYRLSKVGKLPKQVKVSDRSSGFIESEIQDFIKQRMEAR